MQQPEEEFHVENQQPQTESAEPVQTGFDLSAHTRPRPHVSYAGPLAAILQSHVGI